MILKNGNDFQVRKAVPQDAEEIICYLNQVGGESDNLLFGKNGFHMSVEEEKEYIEGVNNSDTSCLLVGILENKIVSLVSITGSSRSRINHHGEIAVSVLKKYWGQGIAGEMIKQIISFAKNTAVIKVVQLEVRSDNQKAIHLYEKLGFKKWGTYEKFFKIEEQYYDADYMNLYLDSEK